VLDDRVRLSRQVRSEYAAARVAESVALIDDTAPAERARLLRLLESPSTVLSLNEPWYERATPVDDDFEVFAGKVAERIAGRYVHQVITLDRRSSGLPPARRAKRRDCVPRLRRPLSSPVC
jgi:hypothetical protein